MSRCIQHPLDRFLASRIDCAARGALLLWAVVIFLGAPVSLRAQSESKCPPPTRTDGVVDEYHRVKIIDPYRWLENQQSPDTRAWIDAEEACTEAALRNFPGRAGIERQLGPLFRLDSVGLPVERKGRYFYAKRRAEQDLFVLYTRPGSHGPEEVLVDPHPLSPDHTTSVYMLDVSQDGETLAYALQIGGQDEATVHFLQTKTKKDLPDVLPSANYFGVSFRPDGRGLYYSRMTANGPRVFYHEFGKPVEEDPLVFGNGYGKDKILTVQVSEEDGRYLLLGVVFGTGSSRAELYLQDLATKSPVVPLVNDIEAVFYGGLAGGKVFVLTNWKAPHWRMLVVDPAHPERDSWREIIPEGDAAMENVVPAGGRFIAQYTRNAVPHLNVYSAAGKPEGEIQLPALGTISGLSSRWKSEEVFFSFESFQIPSSVFRVQVQSRAVEAWAQPQAPMSTGAFETKQVWVTSKDGTRVPMFLFSKKGLVHDGNIPTILTGYGGFSVSETPIFQPGIVTWVERGGLLALVNLRGGNEFGEAWHQAGMLDKKQNVFDDFFAAAEWLIAQKYTTPSRLAIRGGSNGGLLVGAALTQRPELFQAVVCAYPLEDMLRYHKFLEGPFWIPEYGSSEDSAQFKYLYAYSPYHHVEPGVKYPAVLFISGDNDTRVAPLHARKMAARLQAATVSNRPILLLYDTKSGHSGGRPVNKQIELWTDTLTFLFWQLGVPMN
jgi:prolyl oligopeptidase